MANIILFDKKGKKSTQEQSLNDALFGLVPNEHLLYLAKVRQESNARSGTAHSKTRAEVRGGGAKPWKQKGTGRARAGTIRSPLWRGGGVIFGPRNNVNWTKGMNKKESVRALFSAIALASQQGKLAAIEDLSVEAAKTKEIARIIIEAGCVGKNVLFIAETTNPQLDLLKRATRNLVRAKLISTNELNVKDLLKANQIIASTKALAEIEVRFGDLAQAA
jgi:large subunit ribosomal protein L4